MKFNELRPIELAVQHVDKTWGKELILVNNEYHGLCAKYLYINAGSGFSLQYHKEKFEVFSLISGECVLITIDTATGTERVTPILDKPIEIPRLLPHRIEAITDTTILEISTFHRDDDTYRIRI